MRTGPAKNSLCRISAWKTPPNCRRFHDNLYQIHLSGCSALPESRWHSLPHPYSPLEATSFFRISRNRVQSNNPHLNKNFGMKVAMDRPANRRLKNASLVLFENSRFEASRSLKIVESAMRSSGSYEEKVGRGIVTHARRCAQTDGSALKPPLFLLYFSSSCVLGLYQDLAPRPKRVVRRMVGGGIQDSGSMKSRIRNADLLITHVLDPCVKLLVVLHISSAQGRSVDRTSAGSS